MEKKGLINEKSKKWKNVRFFDKTENRWHNRVRNRGNQSCYLVMKGMKVMTEKRVWFKDSEEVENFVSAAGQCDFEIDILCDHIYIDAKSILGVLGLGLRKELTVKYFQIHSGEVYI